MPLFKKITNLFAFFFDGPEKLWPESLIYDIKHKYSRLNRILTKTTTIMNAFLKTVRVLTDIVCLTVLSLELKDQINKIRQRKAATMAAAHATQEEITNE